VDEHQGLRGESTFASCVPGGKLPKVAFLGLSGRAAARSGTGPDLGVPGGSRAYGSTIDPFSRLRFSTLSRPSSVFTIAAHVPEHSSLVQLCATCDGRGDSSRGAPVCSQSEWRVEAFTGKPDGVRARGGRGRGGHAPLGPNPGDERAATRPRGGAREGQGTQCAALWRWWTRLVYVAQILHPLFVGLHSKTRLESGPFATDMAPLAVHCRCLEPGAHDANSTDRSTATHHRTKASTGGPTHFGSGAARRHCQDLRCRVASRFGQRRRRRRRRQSITSSMNNGRVQLFLVRESRGRKNRCPYLAVRVPLPAVVRIGAPSPCRRVRAARAFAGTGRRERLTSSGLRRISPENRHTFRANRSALCW